MSDATTRLKRATSASNFYTMNPINSTIFSVLSGIYTVVSAMFCMILGSPTVTKPVPVKTSTNGRRRVAVITGSNTGIGLASATQLVLNHDIDVILACRSRSKAETAAETINDAAAAAKVSAKAHFLHPCDLSSFESVRQFANAFQEKYDTLDILVCNAGVNNTTEGRTADDLELIFQSNILGHFLLTKSLFEMFPDNGEGRVVTLSSVAHHFVDSNAKLDETYWKSLARLDTSKSSVLPSYFRSVFEDCMQSYPPSKLATLLFAKELNSRFGAENSKTRVRAFSVNPGAVASDIWRSFPVITQPFIQRIFLSTEQGCATSVAAAVGEFEASDDVYLQPYWMPESASRAVPYPVIEMMGPFVGYKVTQPRLPLDEGVFAAKSLWKACEEITDCKFE